MASGCATNQRRKVLKRYYIKGAVVPFEEDLTHEFKGHRNMAVEELPPWAFITGSNKRSRKAVSRTINGFLNTGKGGTVYLGIVDDGTVKGMKLTQYQKDHLLTSMDDLASRYDPPLLKHRYKVRFVPVLDNNCTDDDISALTSFDNTSDTADLDSRERPHICRTHTYCWCDKEAVAVYNNGIFAPDYVIEITVRPWDPNHKENKQLVEGDHKLPPFHSDEEGNCYFRRQASVVAYTPQEIWTMTQQEVKELCQAEIDELKRAIRQLKVS
ncbi:uncharacterized protein LOC135495522 [Lineus longissimus]|uniref:uncharacterized protein LOC135495522 n=1 Tax=Lineus longissimus TaxID=88925 RepID=UPI002B4DA4D9